MTGVLNEHQVREIVRTNLSGNRLKSYSPLPSSGSGTWILNLRHHPFKVVLKIVDDAEMGRLRIEREVARILVRVDRITVPEFISMDDSAGIVPFTYYLRSHIPGLQWNDVMSLLPTPDRLSLARRCGEMLGAFHGIKGDRFGEIGGEGETPSLSALLLDRALANLDGLIDRGEIDSGKGREIREQLLDSVELIDLGQRPQLTHRRLTPADILVKNERGEWIVTGLLGTGGSGMWNHLWDMASITRRLRDEHPDLVTALEESHYGIVSRPEAYEKRLEVYTILESLADSESG